MIQFPVSPITILWLSLIVVKSNHDDMLDALRYITQAFECGRLKIHTGCESILKDFQTYKYERR